MNNLPEPLDYEFDKDTHLPYTWCKFGLSILTDENIGLHPIMWDKLQLIINHHIKEVINEFPYEGLKMIVYFTQDSHEE